MFIPELHERIGRVQNIELNLPNYLNVITLHCIGKTFVEFKDKNGLNRVQLNRIVFFIPVAALCALGIYKQKNTLFLLNEKKFPDRHGC